MSAPDLVAASLCPNCNEPLGGPYCSHCGQENHPEHDYTLWGFIRETWQAFRGRTSVPAALYVLLARPGVLTKAYASGQRIRYVNPIKLFVACSSVCALLSGYFAPEGDLLVSLQSAMSQVDPAEITRWFPWAMGAGKATGYVSYILGMTGLVGLLRAMVPGRRPLADVVFSIHLCTVLLVYETLVGLALSSEGVTGALLAVAGTVLIVTLYCFAALRRAYEISVRDATRVTLAAAALLAPAYFVSLCLQLVAALVVFAVPVVLTFLAEDSQY